MVMLEQQFSKHSGMNEKSINFATYRCNSLRKEDLWHKSHKRQCSLQPRKLYN